MDIIRNFMIGFAAFVLVMIMVCFFYDRRIKPDSKTAKEIHYDTVKVPVIDTLVVMITQDSIDWKQYVKENGIDTLEIYAVAGGSEMRPMELFKDGKRSDTIQKHEVIYYNR